MRLEVRELYAAYQRDLFILQRFSLTVPDEKIVIVIGANGTGKSTLLKAIAGFVRVASGSVLLDGNDITGMAPREMVSRGIGYIPQDRALFQHMSVAENLEMGCWFFRGDRKRVKQSIEWAYQRFPVLAEKRRAQAGSLSGGQQRVLDIAKTLLPDPSLLLIDEPTVGLSPIAAEDIYAELKVLRSEHRSILLVDQDVRSAMAIADEVCIVELGQVKAHGLREEFEGHLGELVRSWLI